MLLRILLRTLWTLIVGSGLLFFVGNNATCRQWWGLSTSPKYETFGKILIHRSRFIDSASQQEIVGTPAQLDISERFLRTQLIILQSDVLRQRGLERLYSLHPEFLDPEKAKDFSSNNLPLPLPEPDVLVTVALGTPPKDATIAIMRAIGSDAKLVRLYLDSLMDEYIALQKEGRDKATAFSTNMFIEEVLVHERDLKTAYAAFQEAEKQKAPAATTERLKEEMNDAKSAYDLWKQILGQTEPRGEGERVAIMERPREITTTEIPVGVNLYGFALVSPTLTSACYASALVLSFLLPRRRPRLLSEVGRGD